jgi:hypothetical protein
MRYAWTDSLDVTHRLDATVDPLITVSELEQRRHDAIVLDASWIYSPLNPAGTDVRALGPMFGHAMPTLTCPVPGFLTWRLSLTRCSDSIGASRRSRRRHRPRCAPR